MWLGSGVTSCSTISDIPMSKRPFAVEVKKPGFSQEAGFLLLRYGHPGGAEEAGLPFVPDLHKIAARRQPGDPGAEVVGAETIAGRSVWIGLSLDELQGGPLVKEVYDHRGAAVVDRPVVLHDDVLPLHPDLHLVPPGAAR
jgi:hypothetical protein